MSQRPITIEGLIDYLNQFDPKAAVLRDASDTREVNAQEDSGQPYILLDNIDLYVEED